MAYSIQTAVSDGTLDVLDLSIRYMDKSHIQVYVDDVLADGSAYSYVWLTDTRIQIVPAVANGSTLKVTRKTLTDEMWHEFTRGARFSTTSMDENFEQLLFLAQEYSEGIYVSDFYTDVEMHLHRILDLADPINDGDAVNLKTLKDFLPYGNEAVGLATRLTAEEQHTTDLAGSYGSTLVGAATYAQLRAYTGNATRIQLGGRSNYFDGGGGLAVRTGNKPDNDGTVWVDALGRSWERVFTGNVNAPWFGAKGDGAYDSTVSILGAIAAADGKPVVLPAGEYVITSTITTPVLASLLGELIQQKGGNNTPADKVMGTVLLWQGNNTSPVFMVDHATTEYALLENLAVVIPNSYAGKVFHFKGSPYFTQGWTYKHRVANLAVYRAGAIGPQTTAAVAYYYDCTQANATQGRAFFGCTADNLTAFNVADLLKIEVANNTAGGATLDNWCNSNVFNNIEGYQVYRGLNIIGGTLAGNGVFRNTFSNVVIQPGLGTNGQYAPEVITGSGATTVADNVFINCVVWDSPSDVFASAWVNSNLRVGGNTSGMHSPTDITAQAKIVAGGNKLAGILQAHGNGGFAAAEHQLHLYDLANPNRQVRAGYDNTRQAGYIQATEAGVANRPLVLNPNGGGVIIIPTTSSTLANNGEVTFDYVSDTQLRVKMRGNDGTTRSVVLNLA